MQSRWLIGCVYDRMQVVGAAACCPDATVHKIVGRPYSLLSGELSAALAQIRPI